VKRASESAKGAPRLLSVCEGQTCIGFLLSRGRAGVEAFNADNKSLGIFPDQKSAADAVSRAGPQP
jgi:hypothetical protein